VELRPDGPGRVVVHSREVDALISPDVDVAGLGQQLHRLACGVVPTLRSSAVLEAEVAWRPIPADGLPSVGGINEISGYYEAVTHSGVTLAAVIGRSIAREVMDGDIEPVVAPYRPARFAVRRRSDA
jgi:glycine/D-amino acid oxidase-like deaminating enzyme